MKDLVLTYLELIEEDDDLITLDELVLLAEIDFSELTNEENPPELPPELELIE